MLNQALMEAAAIGADGALPAPKDGLSRQNRLERNRSGPLEGLLRRVRRLLIAGSNAATAR